MFGTHPSSIALLAILSLGLLMPGCDDSPSTDPPPANIAGVYNAISGGLGIGDPLIFREDGTYLFLDDTDTATFTAGTPGTTPDSLSIFMSTGDINGSGANGQIDPGEVFSVTMGMLTGEIVFNGDGTYRYQIAGGGVVQNRLQGFWSLAGTALELQIGTFGKAEFRGTELYFNSTAGPPDPPVDYSISGNTLDLDGFLLTTTATGTLTLQSGSPWRDVSAAGGTLAGYQQIIEFTVTDTKVLQVSGFSQSTATADIIGGSSIELELGPSGDDFFTFYFDFRTDFELNASGTNLTMFLTEIGQFIQPQEVGSSGTFEVAFSGDIFTQASGNISGSTWSETGGTEHLDLNGDGTWGHFADAGTANELNSGRWFQQGGRVVLSTEMQWQE